MKEFPITALAQIIKAEARPNVEGFVTGASIDSRTLQPGGCFFALPGQTFDGADFLTDAFAKGAACAVVSRNFDDTGFPDNTILKVDDVVRALGDFAYAYRQLLPCRVIAITGSVGKTTTRQIIWYVLSQKFCCHQAPKNYNNDIGLPLTLLGAGPQHQLVIAELGSNRPGDIAYLSQIACPDIAVVTNVHPAHLAGLGNLESIIEEKLSISRGLRQNGTLILNADFPPLLEAARDQDLSFTTFGGPNDSSSNPQNIRLGEYDSRFILNGTEIFLPLPGPGNIENALAAWAVCSKMQITIDDFADALKTLPPVPMRTEMLNIGTLTVICDCYNANPASMKNALDILTRLGSNNNRRLVFVCGDMAELGPQTHSLHNKLGEQIAQTRVHLLLAVGKSANIVADAAKKSADCDLLTKTFEDTLAACDNLEKFVKNSDIVLVKGSRIARLELVIEKLKELFAQQPKPELKY